MALIHPTKSIYTQNELCKVCVLASYSSWRGACRDVVLSPSPPRDELLMGSCWHKFDFGLHFPYTPSISFRIFRIFYEKEYI